jgi:hypothetical protein
MLLCLFAGVASAQPEEGESPSVSEELSPEDLKIVAELETLQLLELAEDMDMLKDINYLIEDDQNETETK